ncbi:HAD-like domain [Pseudocohnilembus persalinus]|uniref:HAD-like domain n=1 Tax=Pseudocohnilembus persalinus TaxID=266149 RepID=A0A0V0R164_PSEPJ|nr:HAD-like domain [Pseudocohnilembus persalinus]|eukprot:KRX08281.1 HAD-like domain [Pseudocohnilembus persalinus]
MRQLYTQISSDESPKKLRSNLSIGSSNANNYIIQNKEKNLLLNSNYQIQTQNSQENQQQQVEIPINKKNFFSKLTSDEYKISTKTPKNGRYYIQKNQENSHNNYYNVNLTTQFSNLNKDKQNFLQKINKNQNLSNIDNKNNNNNQNSNFRENRQNSVQNSRSQRIAYSQKQSRSKNIEAKFLHLPTTQVVQKQKENQQQNQNFIIKFFEQNNQTQNEQQYQQSQDFMVKKNQVEKKISLLQNKRQLSQQIDQRPKFNSPKPQQKNQQNILDQYVSRVDSVNLDNLMKKSQPINYTAKTTPRDDLNRKMQKNDEDFEKNGIIIKLNEINHNHQKVERIRNNSIQGKKVKQNQIVQHKNDKPQYKDKSTNNTQEKNNHLNSNQPQQRKSKIKSQHIRQNFYQQITVGQSGSTLTNITKKNNTNQLKQNKKKQINHEQEQIQKVSNQVDISELKNELSNLTQNESGKTIIFDLDETLIHCNEGVHMPADAFLDINFSTGEEIKLLIGQWNSNFVILRQQRGH